ncbi:glycosyltransferase family A protein [uncultured Algibacter sp.]|uniref:glycosyltransferase family 2 protein n=1 Tax=uncultured Algibacter sp. TaxID=298659 RepID=UPI00261CDA59|nr:glycosyltransferase family A protein [uncultured Algibacter sp.]
MNNDLISIIVPCYNQAEYLPEALQSVLNQTYNNWECIIVNDGATDNTETVAQEWLAKDSRFKYFKKENGGLSSARNLGIEQAKGEYILLLDSDDKINETLIAKALPEFNKDDNIGVVTYWCNRFIDNTIIDVFKPAGGNITNFLYKNSAIGTSMFRKKCWKIIGGYDEEMKNGYEDWEFYIRLTQKWNVFVIPEVLLYYRQHAVSMRKVAVNNYDTEIRKYIFLKHKALYIENYEETITHLLNNVAKNKGLEIKRINSIDYKLGSIILKPLRFIKKLLK